MVHMLYYRMVFSWMILLLQVHMKSDLPIAQINIVILRMQIPMWFNKQNVGNSVSMVPLPNMDDKNFIGGVVACCITFVAHDDPTSLGYEMLPWIWFGIKGIGGLWRCYNINVHHGKDLVTVDLQHLCLLFITGEEFIELKVSVHHPRDLHGFHLEVKNCGYRWIFQEDLEQLNSQMYLTND